MGLVKKIFKLTMVLVIVSSCRGTDKIEESSEDGKTGDASKDSEIDLPADAAAGFNISVQPDSKYTYTIHKGTGISTDVWTTPCRIDPSATGADRDITCIVEAEELDLYFFGIGLRFNVPPSMCNYVLQKLPYFYRYRPGVGPVNAYDNTNGTTTNGGLPAGSKAVTCSYDYSASGGPNCCEGDYTLYTYSDDPDSAVDQVAATAGKWGGKASACLSGPGMTLATSFSSVTGFPFNTIFYIEGVGINSGYFIDPSISTALYSNINAANYFAAADHVLSRPLATTAVGFPDTQLYHEFLCLDRSKEISASIKVMIREWNTAAELVLGAAGNPDLTGSESYGTPINDYNDLKDIAESYPGGAL
jgi:hypothetical protein